MLLTDSDNMRLKPEMPIRGLSPMRQSINQECSQFPGRLSRMHINYLVRPKGKTKETWMRIRMEIGKNRNKAGGQPGPMLGAHTWRPFVAAVGTPGQ